MFLSLNLIVVVWCWFQYGLINTLLFSGVSAIFYLWRARSALILFVFGCIVVLFHLEGEVRHVLPRSMQHTEIDLTICTEQQPKIYGADVVTGYASVVSQPQSLTLRRVKYSIYSPHVKEVPHQSGICYSGTFRLRQPVGRLIPGAFDSDRYFFANNVDALATLVEYRSFDIQPSFPQTLFLRQQRLFNHETSLAIWAALGLGWSNSMPSELKNLFAANQLMHLFVISGMHVGFIAGILVFILSLIGRFSYRYFIISRTGKGITCLVLLVAYVAMLGFPVPATRALIMFALPIYGWITASRLSILNSLTITFLLLTAWQPECWLLLGTWLSFLSAILLLVITQWPPVTRLPGVAQVLVVQIVLSFSILPWAVVAGLDVNPLSIISNILVTPVIAFVLLPLALLLMLLPMVKAQVIFEWISLKLIDLLAWAGQFSIEIPYRRLLIVVLAVTLLISLVWSTRRHALLVGLTLSCFIVVCLKYQSITDVFGLTSSLSPKVTVLDVGHGLSVLFETEEGNVLYDTGGMFNPNNSLYEMSLQRMMPRLDAIVISHSDIDHSAGIDALHDAQPSVPVWAGEPMRLPASVPGKNCHEAAISVPGFRFIPTSTALQNSDNNFSCILLFQYGSQTMLVTGDADKYLEYYLLQTYPERFPVNALVLGHHGSRSSSATDWLKTNRSAIFLTSSGDRLQPKWPAHRIGQWFSANNARLWNTALSGTLTLLFSKNGIVVHGMSSAYRQRIQQHSDLTENLSTLIESGRRSSG